MPYDYNSEEVQEFVKDLFFTHPEFDRRFSKSFEQNKEFIMNMLEMEKTTLFTHVQSKTAKNLIHKLDDYILLEYIEKKLRAMIVVEAAKEEVWNKNNLNLLRNIIELLKQEYLHTRVLADDEVIGKTIQKYVMDYFEMEEAFLFFDIFYYKR